ncbi:hypothetical protein IRJ41_018296, partial [Triplophysa rosa]
SFRQFKCLRRQGGSSRFCCVPFCEASQRFNSVWIQSIRRKDFNITPDTRVCSRHFRSDDVIEPSTPTGRRLLKKGVVPTLFQWNNYSVSTPRRTGVWQMREISPTPPVDEEPGPVDIQNLDHDYCSVSEPAAVDLVLDQTEDLRQEFCLGRFAASDDDIRLYTRFVTYKHLMAFWQLLEPASHKMVCVTRARAATGCSEAGGTNATSLQPIDEFFLFLVHLSVGLTQRDLAHRFNIHQSTVSRKLTTWANFLYTTLGSVRIWMSEEEVKANLPKDFKDYPDAQVIIDCTELRCQTPSSLLLQSEVFSSYKSHCTFKGLIGMAPHGAVTFVSSLYAGSISDKELFKQSGLVSLLKPGMAIMVDKGFLVDDCVSCKVYRPAFLSKREQMSANEVRETQSIARLRVHVERLIRRVKQNKFINQLFTVACLLVNYQNGPLVKAWAKKEA